jgi:hypothetical protein
MEEKTNKGKDKRTRRSKGGKRVVRRVGGEEWRRIDLMFPRDED